MLLSFRLSGLGLAVALLAAVAAVAQIEPSQEQGPPPPAAAPLRIVSDKLPRPVIREAYYFEIRADGGTAPLHWKVDSGDLPSGLTLDEDTGVISGLPTQPGEFHFTVRVTDSGKPQQSQTREFTVNVVSPLLIDWTEPPKLDGSAITGAVKVSNSTKDSCDLTVIVLAVNEFNKAFALGYEHITLHSETEQEVRFSSNVPAGSYIVHADAVAELPSRNTIYRARLQTSTPLVKNVVF